MERAHKHTTHGEQQFWSTENTNAGLFEMLLHNTKVASIKQRLNSTYSTFIRLYGLVGVRFFSLFFFSAVLRCSGWVHLGFYLIMLVIFWQLCLLCLCLWLLRVFFKFLLRLLCCCSQFFLFAAAAACQHTNMKTLYTLLLYSKNIRYIQTFARTYTYTYTRTHDTTLAISLTYVKFKISPYYIFGDCNIRTSLILDVVFQFHPSEMYVTNSKMLESLH